MSGLIEPLRELTGALNDGDFEKVRDLIDAHSEYVNARLENSGVTPLMKAVGSADRTSKLVEFLLKKGADTNLSTREGYTALHCAVLWGSSTCNEETLRQIICMLVDAGANLEAKQHWGWTPLMQAVTEATEIQVRALCDVGARVDHIFPDHTLPECKRGDTMLMATVYNPEMVAILMAAGADPRQRGPKGENAIELAERELREVSQPEYKRKYKERIEQEEADHESHLRAGGVSEEYIVESLARSRVSQIDFESLLRESLRIMNRTTD